MGRKLALGVVAAALFADYLLLTIVIPIYPELLPNTSTGVLGILFASKAICQCICNVPAASLVGRWGPRRCLCYGLTILLISTTGAAIPAGHKYGYMLLARCAQGAASSFVMTAGMSLLALIYPSDQRGAAMGDAMGGVALGVLTGPLLGGVLYDASGAVLPFAIIAGVVAIDGVALAALLAQTSGISDLELGRHMSADPVPGDGADAFTTTSTASISLEKREPLLLPPVDDTERGRSLNGDAASSGSTLWRALSDRSILVVAGALLLANSAIGCLEPLCQIYLQGYYDMAAYQRGLVWSISTLGYLIATPLAGMLADKPSFQRAGSRILVAVGLLILSVGMASIFVLKLLPVTMAALGLIGLALGLIDTPSQPLLAHFAETRLALEDASATFGAVFAVSDSATSLGFVIGPLAGTWLVEALGSSAFGFFIATAGLGAMALVYSPCCFLAIADGDAHERLPASRVEYGGGGERASEGGGDDDEGERHRERRRSSSAARLCDV